jgi:hypothetical protein
MYVAAHACAAIPNMWTLGWLFFGNYFDVKTEARLL